MRNPSFMQPRPATWAFPLFVALTAGTAAVARAQSSGSSTSGNVLLPGSASITTTQFRDTTISYHVIEDRLPNGDSANVVRQAGHEATRHVSYQGRPAIMIVKTIDLNGRTYVDSSAVLAAGLVPLWEVSTLGPRRTTYKYDRSSVRRSITQPDSAKKVVEHDFGTPMFHFEALDDVVRSIPLRAGYQAILPLYSEGDDGIEMDTVRVEGRDTKGVWNVRFADPVIIAHYGIDGTTRTIVRHDIARHADRAHFQYVFDH